MLTGGLMPQATEFDQLLAVVLGITAAGYALRSGLGMLLYLGGALPGRAGQRCRRWSRRVTPRLLLRLGSALLSFGAVGGVAVAPATALQLDRGPLPVAPSVGHASPIPSRAEGGGHGHPGAVPPVVVRPGDCLWSIAARSLPPRSSAARIDREWRRWYRTNRATIGPDPDLISTGIRLVAPR